MFLHIFKYSFKDTEDWCILLPFSSALGLLFGEVLHQLTGSLFSLLIENFVRMLSVFLCSFQNIFLGQQQQLYAYRSQEFGWLTRLLCFLVLIKVQFYFFDKFYLIIRYSFPYNFWPLVKCNFKNQQCLSDRGLVYPVIFWFTFISAGSWNSTSCFLLSFHHQAFKGHSFQVSSPTPSEIVVAKLPTLVLYALKHIPHFNFQEPAFSNARSEICSQ